MESNQQLATHFLNKTHAPHDKNTILATSVLHHSHVAISITDLWTKSPGGRIYTDHLAEYHREFPNCAR